MTIILSGSYAIKQQCSVLQSIVAGADAKDHGWAGWSATKP